MRLLLVVVLVVWQPLRVALTLAATWSSLGVRGPLAAAELAFACAVALLCVTAAWSIWSGAPHATNFARIGLIASAARDVQSLYWTRLPADVPPGSHGVLASLAVANACLWLGLIHIRRD